MGDVVSTKKKSRFIIYEVDDGSGVLSCIQWRQTDDSDEGLFIPELGQLVTVHGKLSQYREEKQLTVSIITPQADPNAEPLHWLEVIQLKKMVYSKPFVLPEGLSTSPDDAATESRDTLGEHIRLMLLEYLHDSIGVGRLFTLPELLADKELAKLCDGAPEGVSMETVSKELSSAIQKLPQEGIVIPAPDSAKQMTTDIVYELFSKEKHLFPVILEYMKTKEDSSSSKLGISEEWLVQLVKQRKEFSNLPNATITSTIEDMVEQSYIYPLGHKIYKSV